MSHHRTKNHSRKSKKNKHEEEEINENVEIEERDSFEEHSEEESNQSQNRLNDRTIKRLKSKINGWLDFDDKIKILNTKVKKYKDFKKQQEDLIIQMITKLELADKRIDVHDDNGNVRSRVYRHKSVTKEALKENIIKDALMEIIKNERKVDQLIKKIDDKRPLKERYYLKRTKGSKKE